MNGICSIRSQKEWNAQWKGKMLNSDDCGEEQKYVCEDLVSCI